MKKVDIMPITPFKTQGFQFGYDGTNKYKRWIKENGEIMEWEDASDVMLFGYELEKYVQDYYPKELYPYLDGIYGYVQGWLIGKGYIYSTDLHIRLMRYYPSLMTKWSIDYIQSIKSNLTKPNNGINKK